MPTSETPRQAAIRQSVGGENDGPSRQLGRFVKIVAENDETDMRIRRRLPPRPLPARQRPHLVLSQGYPAAASPSRTRTSPTSIRTSRVENGVQFGDLPEFCDFGYMARVAGERRGAVVAGARPGHAQEPPRLTQTLNNDTDLAWDRGTEPDLAGYEVVWRETTEPDWTHVIPVGDVTSATSRTSPRTTSSSGSVRWTTTVITARWPGRTRRPDPGLTVCATEMTVALTW